MSHRIWASECVACKIMVSCSAGQGSFQELAQDMGRLGSQKTEIQSLCQLNGPKRYQDIQTNTTGDKSYKEEAKSYTNIESNTTGNESDKEKLIPLAMKVIRKRLKGTLILKPIPLVMKVIRKRLSDTKILKPIPLAMRNQLTMKTWKNWGTLT
ncbi:hypothetical protein KEM48_007889 [Puccinia striiformis f. sp. tritici PST-130]|uniref:Uncharacterized protein n=1 Tax=Puccinia striiformis f. sp. tritici PST-78 TaxID=1165861 RepID=A0A0L0UQY6_9BASI|nr:hypothetical protein KEM48_007889 [Puccinia striiformis f. sp. tritici PST-130]KNE89335.1 hypothetical protein PSTG_17208 [Puccinia striiformis f. sp. tritici PST-78]KNE89336.1 hypothetical protein PSTG_17209 [Puccinia striiformis f. sp. tritici PST-78]